MIKKTIFALCLACVASVSFATSGHYQTPLSQWANFSGATVVNGGRNQVALGLATQAVAAINADLVLDGGRWALSDDFLFGPNIQLTIPLRSSFNLNAGRVLRFDSTKFAAPPAPIFVGSGIITGCVDCAVSHHTEWSASFSGAYYLTNCAPLIGGDDIASSAIEERHFVAGALTNAIGEGGITTWHILDGTITSNDIAKVTISTNNLSEDLFSRLIPVGTILPFGGGGSTKPGGFLMCDGSAYTEDAYPALWGVIGTKWGDGTDLDGSDPGNCDFNVPDLRGTFLRGDNDMYDTDGGHFTSTGESSWADDEWADTDAGEREARHTGGREGRNSGSFQEDTFKLHTHGMNADTKTQRDRQDGIGDNPLHDNPEYRRGDVSYTGRRTVWGSPQAGPDDIIDTNSEGGGESRPSNASVKFIIKY